MMQLRDVCKLRYVQLFFERTPGALEGDTWHELDDLEDRVSAKASKAWHTYLNASISRVRAVNQQREKEVLSHRLNQLVMNANQWSKAGRDAGREKGGGKSKGKDRGKGKDAEGQMVKVLASLKKARESFNKDFMATSVRRGVTKMAAHNSDDAREMTQLGEELRVMLQELAVLQEANGGEASVVACVKATRWVNLVMRVRNEMQSDSENDDLEAAVGEADEAIDVALGKVCSLVRTQYLLMVRKMHPDKLGRELTLVEQGLFDEVQLASQTCGTSLGGGRRGWMGGLDGGGGEGEGLG